MELPLAAGSAVIFGVADSAGGVAARRAPSVVVTALAQFSGLLLLVPATLLVAGRPSAAAALGGAVAGIAGATGLFLYFMGLAIGPMGVVAPLSAVVGAGLPLAVGVLGGERPGPLSAVAIAIALVAIVLATGGTARGGGSVTGLLLGLGSGVGFGVFFTALGTTPDDSGLWPLLVGRLTAVPLLAVILVVGRHRGPWPGWRLMALSGLLDVAANVLFVLAVRAGTLGVSAVVVSLYPVVVVVVAWLVLRERLTGVQLCSVGLALAAGALLATGG